HSRSASVRLGSLVCAKAGKVAMRKTATAARAMRSNTLTAIVRLPPGHRSVDEWLGGNKAEDAFVIGCGLGGNADLEDAARRRTRDDGDALAGEEGRNVGHPRVGPEGHQREGQVGPFRSG